MRITPPTGGDDRGEKNLPVEDPDAHQRTQTHLRVPKVSQIIALSVMLMGAVTLASAGCNAFGSSTVPKGSASDSKQISASSENRIAQNSQVGSLITTLKGHSGSVTEVSFSPDGQTIASRSEDGVKLWKRDGTLITTLKESKGYGNISFSSDGQTLPGRFAPRKQAVHGYVLAASNGPDTIRLWKPDGTIVTTLKRSGIGIASHFSPDGQTIVSGGADSNRYGIIKLWKRDGTLIKTLKGHSQAVTDLRFSPDGQMFVSGDADGIIKLWKRDGTRIRTVTAHQDRGFLGARVVSDLRFSPDGQTIASIGFADIVKLWRRDGTPIATLKGSSIVMAIQFSPDGQTIASAGGWMKDGDITLLKRDGTQIKIWHGNSPVYSVSLSPDGKTLASGGEDKTIKLWKVN